MGIGELLIVHNPNFKDIKTKETAKLQLMFLLSTFRIYLPNLQHTPQIIIQGIATY